MPMMDFKIFETFGYVRIMKTASGHKSKYLDRNK